MNSFEQEFYRSPWHRALPVGPDGIEPYVRPGRPGRVAGRQHRLAATLRALARGFSSFVQRLGAFGPFGRWGATGGAGHATLAHATRRGQPLSVRPSTCRAAQGGLASGQAGPIGKN